MDISNDKLVQDLTIALNTSTSILWSPLLEEVKKRGLLDVVIKFTNHDYLTILAIAIECSNWEAAKLIIEGKADCNAEISYSFSSSLIKGQLTNMKDLIMYKAYSDELVDVDGATNIRKQTLEEGVEFMREIYENSHVLGGHSNISNEV